jgi:GDP-4-dehydro-6-deoxy-D-mannose reductase
MRVLVTGAAGFVGGHAIPELRRAGHSVIAMVMPGQSTALAGSDVTGAIELGDAAGIESFIQRHQPDACLHLAGMAFVPTAWEQPQEAFRVNVIGTLNILEAFRKHRPGGRILTVTSAQLYGHAVRDEAITENTPPVADSIYSVSKWASDNCTRLYAERYGMHTMTARPCNHIGPGQSESFVVSSFARQMIEISLGRREPVMRVGNLASEREFTDVRDVVRAYRLLLEKGRAGEAYNISSGRLLKIQSVFDQLAAIVGVKPELRVDEKLFRPTDTQPQISTDKLQDDTGWKTEIPLEQTLQDIVADFRGRVG